MPHDKPESISLEDFIAAATRGALRALADSGVTADLNPQPLPPGKVEAVRLPPGRIFIGIVPFPEESAQ